MSFTNYLKQSFSKSKVGATLPGHNYIGPGNPLENGPAVNKTDQIAKVHDYAYSNAKTEQDVFDADWKAIKEFGEEAIIHKSIPAVLGVLGLGGKTVVERIRGKPFYPSMQAPKSTGTKRPSEFLTPPHTPKKSSIEENIDRVLGTGRHGHMANQGDNTINTGTSMPTPMDTSNVGSNDTSGVSIPGMGSHGQTGTIFTGTVPEITKSILKFSKTYRWHLTTSKPAKLSAKSGTYFDAGSMHAIPVEYIWFYVSEDEWNYLKEHDSVKVLHASCTVSSYGVRLPFVTNESKSLTANASAQYPLVRWHNLDRDYLVGNRTNLAQLKEACWGKNFEITTEDSNWIEFTDHDLLPARAVSRQFDNRVFIYIPRPLRKASQEQERIGPPFFIPNLHQYAQVLNGTMNLDKVFEWSHIPACGQIFQRSGWAGLDSSIAEEDPDVAMYHMTQEVTIAGKNPTSHSNSTTKAVFNDLSVLASQAPLLHILIDNPNIRRNGVPSKNPYIPKFIVGLQQLVNLDKSYIDAVWEFATECHITIEVTKSCRGHNFNANHSHCGYNPTMRLGKDAQAIFTDGLQRAYFGGYQLKNTNDPPEESVADGLRKRNGDLHNKLVKEKSKRQRRQVDDTELPEKIQIIPKMTL